MQYELTKKAIVLLAYKNVFLSNFLAIRKFKDRKALQNIHKIFQKMCKSRCRLCKKSMQIVQKSSLIIKKVTTDLAKVIPDCVKFPQIVKKIHFHIISKTAIFNGNMFAK